MKVTTSVNWKGIKPDIENALWAAALVVEGQAKELCPIKTGRLKGSLTAMTSKQQTNMQNPAEPPDKMTGIAEENTAYVGTNVKYAMFVEDGTSRQKPQSYLLRGAEVAKEAAMTAFENQLKKDNP
jgi:hypothetical protein